MPASGTATFFDPSEYQAGFRGATINLVFTGPGIFAARQTTVDLPHLKLFSVQESLPRTAYVSLAPEAVSFSFPMLANSTLIWGGLEMKARDLMFHSVGERMHQRTTGASRWGLISVELEFFAGFSKALAGSKITPPRIGQVLRPPRADMVELQRLHAKACRLVETNPQGVMHREVARAIEHDIIYALVNCLTANVVHKDTAARIRQATGMTRFEKVLVAKFDRQSPVPELCKAIGVSERTLRSCCFDFLGMGPSHYIRLRRLNLVHMALLRADPATARISDIAEHYGFTEFGRLAGFYRTIFGETPSATLRRPRQSNQNSVQLAGNA